MTMNRCHHFCLKRRKKGMQPTSWIFSAWCIRHAYNGYDQSHMNVHVLLPSPLKDSDILFSPGFDVTYTNWHQGQPDNRNEHCIEISIHHKLQWNNFRCNEAREFICERKALVCSKRLCLLMTLVGLNVDEYYLIHESVDTM